jgi:flagella basal body P-ring formation protein FlgA
MRLASVKSMNKTTPLRACFLTLLVQSAAAADQGAMQSVEELQRFAENYIAERLNPGGNPDTRLLATAGKMDPRLRLPICSSALQAVMPATTSLSASLTLGVRCANPSWTVYIPMTVETELKVLVMRSAAARNSRPGEADVELQQRRVPGIASTYLTRIEELSGRHLKQPVSAGTPLTVDLLAADILIKRGQRVTLIASASGIDIQAQGEAIADATSTGRVRVLNLSSRKIVEGQAETSDRVRVSL